VNTVSVLGEVLLTWKKDEMPASPVDVRKPDPTQGTQYHV